jgi:hypothetical protein
MAILVNASLMSLIKKQCVLVEGQVQCFIPQFTPKETLNILNIYATLTSHEHGHMWLDLAKNLPLDPSQRFQHVGTRCLNQQKHEAQRDLGLAPTNNPPRGGGCPALRLLAQTLRRHSHLTMSAKEPKRHSRASTICMYPWVSTKRKATWK